MRCYQHFAQFESSSSLTTSSQCGKASKYLLTIPREESHLKMQDLNEGLTNLEVGLEPHGSIITSRLKSTVRSRPSDRVSRNPLEDDKNNVLTLEEHFEEKFQALKSTLENTTKYQSYHSLDMTLHSNLIPIIFLGGLCELGLSSRSSSLFGCPSSLIFFFPQMESAVLNIKVTHSVGEDISLKVT